MTVSGPAGPDGSDASPAAAARPPRQTAWRTLAASDTERAAADRRRRASRWGGGRLDDMPDRCQATVCGTLRSVTLRPGASSSTLEAELCDGTASVVLVWLGRRCVPGIEPGRSLRAHGALTERSSQRVIYNPRYELLPADA